MEAYDIKPDRLKAVEVYLDLLVGLHCSTALMQKGQEPIKYGNTTNYPVKQPNYMHLKQNQQNLINTLHADISI